MPADIFISYSREDHKKIIPIVEKLRCLGHTVWIDQEGIQGAKLWSKEIVTAIENCKVFILFASEVAFNSKNVTKELAIASEAEKHILPVFLEKAKIPSAMKYQLAGIQHLQPDRLNPDEIAEKIILTIDNLNEDTVTSKHISRNLSNDSFSPNRKKQAVIALGVSVFVLIFIILTKRYESTGKNQQSTSIDSKSTIDLCVITLKDSKSEEASDIDQEIKDTLISKLTYFRDFKVIQGTNIGKEMSTADYINVGVKADADFVLQITCNDNKKTVQARICDVTTGRIFWTKKIESDEWAPDLDLIEDASNIIAANVAGYDGCVHREILQNALAKQEESLTAIELLQIGKSVWDDVDEESVAKAIVTLNRCIDINPKISTAYAILADCYTQSIRDNYSFENAKELADENISMAIKLDPKNAVAIATQYWVEFLKKDKITSEILAQDAIAANPNEPYALATYAWHLIVDSANEELALEYAEKALQYCEYPQLWYYWPLSEYYKLKKDYKNALKYRLKSIHREIESDYVFISTCNWLLGNKELAFATYGDLILKFPDFNITKFRENRHIHDVNVVEGFELAFDDLVMAYYKRGIESTP